MSDGFTAPECPMCGTRIVFPDCPTRAARNGRLLVVDAPCGGCPATVTFIEKTGVLVCFTPNQLTRVRIAR